MNNQTMRYELSVNNKVYDPQWDEFVLNTPYGHYAQSSLWAQAQEVRGWNCLRIVLKNQGKIVCGAQLLTKKFPLIGSLGYLFKGPVCNENDPNLSRLMVDYIHKVCKQEGLFFLGWRPTDSGEIFVPFLLDMGYVVSEQLHEPTNTILIDLTQDIETILARMSNTKRNAIRRVERNKELIMRFGTKDDVSTFYALHSYSSERIGFTPYPEAYYQKLWDVFEPYGFIKLLLIEYNGEPITADIIIPFRDTVYAYKHGWSGTYPKAFPNEAVYWEAIKWAKANGYRFFDFGGVDDVIAQMISSKVEIPAWAKKTYNLFKVEFGGDLVFTPDTYEHIFNPLLNWGYRKIYPLVKDVGIEDLIIKLYKKGMQRREN